MTWIVAVLPGLLVIAVFVALRFALGRWYDRQPGSAWTVYALLLFLLFGKALFLGSVLLPLNILWYTPPWQDLPRVAPTALLLQWDLVQDFAGYTAEHHRLVSAGEWPLINRNVGAGEPFLADIQAQHLHPFTLLSDLLPPASAPGLVAALKLLFALVFFGALLRRIGLGNASALGGSLAYGLSGFFMLYLGWPHTHSAAAFPMICYALLRWWGEGRRRDALLLAAGFFLLVTGGHPETAVYVGLGVGIFGLATLPLLQGLGRSVVLKRLLGAGLAAFLGVALAAPTVVPFLLQMDRSERAWANDIRVAAIRGGREVHPATPDVLLQRSLPIVAPLAYGSDRYGQSWGYASIIQEGTSFAGTTALCAVALWFFLSWRSRLRFPGERATFAMLAIGLLFVIQPPGLVRWMIEVPVLGSSGSENRRLALFTCFALSFLAACSWERLQRHSKRPRAWWLVVPVAIAGLVAWAYSVSANPENPAIQEGPRTTARLLQLGVIAALALTVAFASRGERWRERLRAIGVVFPLLVGLELFQLHGVFSPPMPRTHYFPPKASTEFLKENLGSQRMVGVGGAFQESYPLVLGIADVRSASPLQPEVFQRLTRRLREGRFSRRYSVTDDPLLDLLGVRYVVTVPGARLEPPLERVFEGNVDVWERPRPMNLAFLARRARLQEAGWIEQVESVSDFHSRTLVDALPEPGQRTWRARRPREDRMLAIEDTPSHVRLELDCSEDCLVATSLYQDGGWRALIDGEPIDPVITNGIFVGAWAPAGKRVVDLVYRPPGLLAGAAVCALALVVGGVWWRWPRGEPHRG